MRKVLFIFSVLTDADVEWLGHAGERMHVDPGMELVALGARLEHLYFVLDGRLSIVTSRGEALRMLESGEVIGEMSLVDPAPTSVSVRTPSAPAISPQPVANRLSRTRILSPRERTFESAASHAPCPLAA